MLRLEAIAYYHSLLEARFDPKTWWASLVGDLQRHAVTPGEVLRPYMIERARYEAMIAVAGEVAARIVEAADRLAADAALRRRLRIPEYLEPLIAIDRAHGLPSRLARVDGIVDDQGRLSIIEYNSEPKTLTQQLEIERALLRQPLASAFRERYPVASVDLFDEMFAALEGKTVAVLARPPFRNAQTALTFRPLMYAAARGSTVIFVEPDELEYRQGKLQRGACPIDIVAFADWSLLINRRDRLTQIVRAIEEQAVSVLHGLSRGLLASYKSVLELVDHPNVPWTRVLFERKTKRQGDTIDLMSHVAAHRDDFVIKRAGGGGGFNVTVGRAVDDAAWQHAIAQATKQPLVVQRYVAPERQRFPVRQADGDVVFQELNCELSPYVWNAQRVAGALCRASADPVVAMQRGSGAIAGTWIVGP